MKIAICTDIQEYQANRILNKSWGKKFPDALWVYYLAKSLKKNEIEVATEDIALDNIRTKRWRPKDILVIQHLDSLHGQRLVTLGALPFILICFETPLYGYNFYDNLQRTAPKYRYRILFSGSLKHLKVHSGKNFPAYLPYFTSEDIHSILDWNTRKFLVMVVANKYFEKPFPLPFPHYLSEYFDWARDRFTKWRSPTRKLVIKNELITKRLEAIEYFGSIDKINLFGYDWDNIQYYLPFSWQKRLEKILKKLKPKPVEDKLKTISAYKFAICFENVSYPGCITEKIIDCFVAGVIPIYLGAPDIEKTIPTNSFIDMRNFKSWKKLDEHLSIIDSNQAEKIIKSGREFLKSKIGKLYNVRGFANFIMKLTLNSIPHH